VRSTPSQVLDRMLEVAGRLFATHRYHEVRMDDICAEVGVGKGTLYRHFKDKEELYLALLRRAAEQINRRLEEALAPIKGVVAKLEVLVETVLGFFDDQPHLFDLIQRAEVLRGHDFPWKHAREEMLQRVNGLFDEARQKGEFVIADPELAALMLLGGLRSVIRFGKRPRPPDLARRLVANFLEGAARKEKRAGSGPRRRNGAYQPAM
jgi:AcrR family transcriptional regulator